MLKMATMKQLKSLWIDSGKTPFTDAAANTLAGLLSLEEFDLQGSHLSDAGISKLAALTNLRMPYVCGSGKQGSKISDESAAAVAMLTKLEQLGIQQTQLSPEGVR